MVFIKKKGSDVRPISVYLIYSYYEVHKSHTKKAVWDELDSGLIKGSWKYEDASYISLSFLGSAFNLF